MQPDKNCVASEIIQDAFQQWDAPFIKNLFQNPVYDRALGALFGAFIGDSLGSYCQFKPELSQEQMDQVMEMPGGGTFQISPGQFTDDSQLATHLLQAICTFNQKDPFKDQLTSLTISIAKQYISWYDSVPFDIGITTQTAFSILKNALTTNATKQDLIKAYQLIFNYNCHSLSNGSLMRIVPMAVFVAFIKKFRPQDSDVAVKQLIKNQVHMTHGNQIMISAGNSWVHMISNLIIRENDSIKTIEEIFQRACQECSANQFVNEWKDEGLKPDLMIATEKMGFQKIAFSYGINQLSKLIKTCKEEEKSIDAQPFFQQSMRKVIQKGGDTDTNAAIVGGLLGSVVGFKNLPSKYLTKQLQLRLPAQRTENIYQRCSFYEPRKGLLMLTKLFAKFK